MPRDQRITALEKQRRVRIIQEWIIDDLPTMDILRDAAVKWRISERQARRYLLEATEGWVEVNQEKLEVKRARRIETLKKLKRSLQAQYKGSPEGIRAVLQVDKEIARLEGAYPTKSMIEAEVARSAAGANDPLAITGGPLVIEALMPYGHTEAVNTPNP